MLPLSILAAPDNPRGLLNYMQIARLTFRETSVHIPMVHGGLILFCNHNKEYRI